MRDLAVGLAQQRARHHYRDRHVLDGPQGPEVSIRGRQYLSFCSNDYLGLANHPALIGALQEGVARYGVGSGASHLITGHSQAHHNLEDILADLTSRPRALVFSTGYMANLAVLGTLARRNDYVYEDRLNHASLIDAARLAGVRLRRYRHGCTAHLAALLSATESAGDSFIVSDAIFSMDGDNAPLADLAELARKHDSWLVVDDAHGLGVNGAEGRGTLAEQGLTLGDVPVLVGTLGKAFGTFGAFVAGSDDLIETLIQRARPYIYTTALPPAVAHASIAAIEIARREEWRRERLRELAARLRRGAIQLGLDLPPTSPILPLIVGDAARAVALSSALWARGIIIKAIRPPTVPEGTSRLRITLSAAHSDAHIDRLLTALDEVL